MFFLNNQQNQLAQELIENIEGFFKCYKEVLTALNEKKTWVFVPKNT